MKSGILYAAAALWAACLCSVPGFCADLDDGISADPTEFGSELKRETNVKYAKVKAKAKARHGGGDGDVFGSDDGTNNIGSAVVGGDVKGDVIIIMEDVGDITTVSE